MLLINNVLLLQGVISAETECEYENCMCASRFQFLIENAVAFVFDARFLGLGRSAE
jgi:hypothetical protein